MYCQLCQNAVKKEGAVTMQMSGGSLDKLFRRKFVLCERCAAGILEKFYRADPICRKCDTEEGAETD